MEVEGILEIFGRSIEKFRVIHEFCNGDGDSKTFNKIQESKQYREITVKKKECVLHVKNAYPEEERMLDKILQNERGCKKHQNKKLQNKQLLKKK